MLPLAIDRLEAVPDMLAALGRRIGAHGADERHARPAAAPRRWRGAPRRRGRGRAAPPPRARSRLAAASRPAMCVSARRRRKLAASAAGSLLKVCGIEGCTRRSVMPAHVCAVVLVEPRAPPAASAATIAAPRRASGQCAPSGEIAEPRRQRRRQHGEQAQPVDADDRRDLQQREPAGKSAGPGIAHEIPRKAGEDMAAQPFGARPRPPPAPGCAACRRD